MDAARSLRWALRSSKLPAYDPEAKLRQITTTLAVTCLLGGCLPVPPPPTQLLDPKLLLVEQIVVASGEHSEPLSSMPPGLSRSAALPGDRVRLRPVAVGPDGPLELDDVILIRGQSLLSLPREGTIPTCADDGLDGPQICRLAGDELLIPPLFYRPHYPVSVIVSELGGPGAEECLERLRRRDGRELFGCLLANHWLELGPNFKLGQAQVQVQMNPVIAPYAEPNYRLSSVWLDLSIEGSHDERQLIAQHGDVITVRRGDRITATVAAPEDELQEYFYFAQDDWHAADERLSARWWSTAEILGNLDPGIYASSSQDFDAPDDEDDYHLFVLVSERSNAFATGHLLWIRVVLGEDPGEDGGSTP